MDFLSQYQFWFGVLNVCLIIGVGVLNFLNHQKIVGNDLVHLSKDVKEFKLTQDKEHEKIQSDLSLVQKDVSYIKGKLDLEK